MVEGSRLSVEDTPLSPSPDPNPAAHLLASIFSVGSLREVMRSQWIIFTVPTVNEFFPAGLYQGMLSSACLGRCPL